LQQSGKSIRNYQEKKIMKSKNAERIEELLFLAIEQLEKGINTPGEKLIIRTVLRRACEKLAGNARCNKHKTEFISIKALKGLKTDTVDYSKFLAEHVMPLSGLYKRLNESTTIEELMKLCKQYKSMCLITTEEDKILNHLKLTKNMPPMPMNKFARYERAGIEYVKR
jgi:hypothetical protein